MIDIYLAYFRKVEDQICANNFYVRRVCMTILNIRIQNPSKKDIYKT